MNYVSDDVKEVLPLLEGVQHLSAAEKETIGVDPSPDDKPKEVDLEELVTSKRPIKVGALKIQTIRQAGYKAKRLRNVHFPTINNSGRRNVSKIPTVYPPGANICKHLAPVHPRPLFGRYLTN